MKGLTIFGIFDILKAPLSFFRNLKPLLASTAQAAQASSAASQKIDALVLLIDKSWILKWHGHWLRNLKISDFSKRFVCWKVIRLYFLHLYPCFLPPSEHQRAPPPPGKASPAHHLRSRYPKQRSKPKWHGLPVNPEGKLGMDCSSVDYISCESTINYVLFFDFLTLN